MKQEGKEECFIHKSNEKMHAATYKARMTEDTFQILFDVMDRHFAALSLPDPASDPKITRAISFSELPSSRRIFIEQCYQTDNSEHLVRQYSCEQVFDKTSHTREVKVSEVLRSGSEHCLTNVWKTTLPAFSSYGNSGWHNSHFGQTARAIEPPPTNRMESMEIEEVDVKPFKHPFAKDNSKAESRNIPVFELNGMSLSEKRSEEKPLIRAATFGIPSTTSGIPTPAPVVRSKSSSPKKTFERPSSAESKPIENIKMERKVVTIADYDEIKKKLRSLVPGDPNKSKKSRFSCSCYKFIFFILLSLCVGIVSILTHDANLAWHKRGFDFANMSSELRNSVYGQENAVEQLINELQKSRSGINLVALVGGTGVGKSYAVGIVRKYFPHVDHVFEYFAPLRRSVSEVFDALSQQHCNLIILESLKQKDTQDVVDFIKFTRKQINRTCIYAIAVFNPQLMDEHLVRTLDLKMSIAEIITVFRENDLKDINVIGFQHLDEAAIDACIRRVVEETGVKLPEAQLEGIRETLLSANSGCKGAYAKIQLLKNS